MAVRKFQTSLPRLGFRLPNIFAKKSTAEVHNETLHCVIQPASKPEKKLVSKFSLQIDVIMYTIELRPVRRNRRKLDFYEYQLLHKSVAATFSLP